MNLSNRLFTLCLAQLAAVLVAILALAIWPQPAFSLANCGTAVPLSIAAGPNGCDIQLGLSRNYDAGAQTSVSLASTNLVLEFHKSQSNSGIWYHVGKLDGTNVVWGGSQGAGLNGYWPTVIMNQQGYVVVVWSNNQYRSGSEQYYRVGKLNINGDQNQSIQWLTGSNHWDGGFHTSLAINNNGVIVSVHESNSNSNHNLYYRRGHLTNPAGGNYNITWDSGSSGVQYEVGINPHIAVNDNGQVVEVHQVPDENLLHYARGTLNGGGKIDFAKDHPRYNSNGRQAAIALTNNGFVSEVHVQGDFLKGDLLLRMVGKLHSTNAALIDWSGANFINSAPPTEGGGGTYPAISSNGSNVVLTHGYGAGLYSSSSAIRDRNNWMGDMLSSIGGKDLGHIVFPGSHDAGMYCDGAGAPGKTQDQSIYDQLQGGVRYFDLRVKNGDPQRIYHGLATVTCDTVSRVMGDVRRFMDEGHKEVVVLKFSHFLNFGACRETNEYNRLRATIADNLGSYQYKEPIHPARVALSEIVGNGGKVVVVVDGDWAAPECNQVQSGFYVYKDWCSGSTPCDSTGNPAQGQFTVFDWYSNTSSYDAMKSDQLYKFSIFDGKMKTDPSVKCDLFLLSWTLTPPITTIPSPVEYYSVPANRNLGEAMNSVKANGYGFIPNVLYVDYYERARVTDTAIAMMSRGLGAASCGASRLKKACILGRRF